MDSGGIEVENPYCGGRRERKTWAKTNYYKGFRALAHDTTNSMSVYIASAKRTAFGAFGGSLKSLTASQVRSTAGLQT